MSKKIRPRITPEEYGIVKEYRERHQALSEECDSNDIPFEDVNHYWYKSDKFSMFVKKTKKTFKDMQEELVNSIKDYSPKYPNLKREKYTDGHLLVVDPADVHIGKLARAFETGEEYNSQIARERVLEGVNGILEKVQGFNIERILFIGGNDKLHIDTPKRTTTSGTPQDTDGMWYDNFLMAAQLEIEVLEMLLTVADVHFINNLSNHDYTNGFFLAEVIKTWFRNNDNISFDCSMSHRKYYRYGKNLIGSTHGDGAKMQDLPLLMAQESPEWSDTKHRYVYIHHIHHKQVKDFIGVTVESLRSPSSADSWHHRNGYQHSPKAIEGFLHHREHGQIARISHLF